MKRFEKSLNQGQAQINSGLTLLICENLLLLSVVPGQYL